MPVSIRSVPRSSSPQVLQPDTLNAITDAFRLARRASRTIEEAQAEAAELAERIARQHREAA